MVGRKPTLDPDDFKGREERRKEEQMAIRVEARQKLVALYRETGWHDARYNDELRGLLCSRGSKERNMTVLGLAEQRAQTAAAELARSRPMLWTPTGYQRRKRAKSPFSRLFTELHPPPDREKWPEVERCMSPMHCYRPHPL